MTSLAVLAADAHGPVVRHRVRALEPWLERAGFDRLTVHGVPKRLRERRALFRDVSDADLVLLLRRLFTGSVFRALRRSARRLAYDLDDAVMFRDPFRGKPVSRVRRLRFRRTARGADLVIAGNAYLGELVSEDAPETPCVLSPTPVDTDLYTPDTSRSPGQRVGWIGSRATRPYLRGIAGALAELVASDPRVEIAVMADEPPVALAGVPHVFTPWSEAAEIPFLRSLDVGLMPLSDDPFSRGKCGFKLLQYMACGVPSVASPVGVNGDILDGGRAGLLAQHGAAWAAAIRALLDEPARRAAMGEAARALAEDRWSTRTVGPAFAAALAECAAGERVA